MLQKLFQKIANEAKFPTNFMRSGLHCYNPEKGSMRKGNQRTLSLSNNISAKQIQQGIKSKTTHMYTHHHIISHHVTCQVVKYSKYLTTSGYGHLPIRRDVGLEQILETHDCARHPLFGSSHRGPREETRPGAFWELGAVAVY